VEVLPVMVVEKVVALMADSKGVVAQADTLDKAAR
jgi:hypothetical protein